MEGRYARTEVLGGVGRLGMQRLRKASVAIVGMGGLGSAVAPVLAAQGVGRILLMDDDVVSDSNLPRQLLYVEEDVGKSKVVRAADRLKRMARDCRVEPHGVRLDEHSVDLLNGVDVVLDCTDNFEAQYLIDGHVVGPVVWGSVEGYKGQVSLLHGRREVSLVDLFGRVSDAIACMRAVWPPLVHTVGQVMASEALGWLLDWECELDGALWMMDMRSYATRCLRVG